MKHNQMYVISTIQYVSVYFALLHVMRHIPEVSCQLFDPELIQGAEPSWSLVHGPPDWPNTSGDLQHMDGHISTWRTDFLKDGKACQNVPPDRSLLSLEIDQKRYLYDYVEVVQPQLVGVILYSKPGCQGDVVRILSKDDEEAARLDIAGYMWMLDSSADANPQEQTANKGPQAPLTNVLSMEPIFDENKYVGAAYIGLDDNTDKDLTDFGDAARIYLRSEFVLIYKTIDEADTYDRFSGSISSARHDYENHPNQRDCFQLPAHESIVFLATLQYSKKYAMEEEGFDEDDWQPQIVSWEIYNDKNCVGEPLKVIGQANSMAVEKLFARYWGFEDESGLGGALAVKLIWKNTREAAGNTD